MRVVPKYKKDFGSVMVPYDMKYATGQNFAENKEKIWASLQPNSNKVIAEKSKLIAKLCDNNGKEMPTFTQESLVGNYTHLHQSQIAK